MSEPQQHPLAVALGHGWLWLYRPETDTVIVLNEASGLFFEVAAFALDQPETWAEVAAAMLLRQRCGGRGRHAVVCEVRDGVRTYRAAPW
jgi:hypothetical protein